MNRIRLVVAAAIVASIGVLPAAVAAESEPVDLGGSAVEGSTEESAPTAVKAGVWGDTLEAGEDVHHFSYRRTSNFSTVHVGVVATTDQDYDTLTLEGTVGKDGTCGSTTGSPPAANMTFGAQLAFEGAGPEDRNDECLTSDVVNFSVAHSGEDADMPFALTVVEERSTEPGSTVDLPAGTETAPAYTAPEVKGSSDEVTGASSFDEAPSLDDGTSSDTIQSGDELLYAVDDVDWGQTVAVRVTSPKLSAEQAEKAGISTPSITASLRGPLRNPVDESTDDANSQSSLGEDEAVTATTAAGPVRYMNVYGGSSPSFLPGRHWVSVQMTGSGDDQPIEVPIDIEVEVQGDRTGAPTYGEGDDGFLVGEDEWSATASADGGGASTLRLVLAGVVALLGAACVAVGTLRLVRRRP